MLCKREDGKLKVIGDAKIVEYPIDSEKMGFAICDLNGRFPKEGFNMNEGIEELIYVVSGSGKIFIEGEVFELNVGDVFVIKPNKKYYFEVKDMKMIIPTSPPFFEEQAKRSID